MQETRRVECETRGVAETVDYETQAIGVEFGRKN